jgi:hypothetical protein
MSDITALIGDLSAQVKVGWTIWFAWGVVLMGWYHHARIVAPVAPMAPPVRFMPTPADLTNDPNEEGLAYADPTELPGVPQ